MGNHSYAPKPKTLTAKLPDHYVNGPMLLINLDCGDSKANESRLDTSKEPKVITLWRKATKDPYFSLTSGSQALKETLTEIIYGMLGFEDCAIQGVQFTPKGIAVLFPSYPIRNKVGRAFNTWGSKVAKHAVLVNAEECSDTTFYFVVMHIDESALNEAWHGTFNSAYKAFVNDNPIILDNTPLRYRVKEIIQLGVGSSWKVGVDSSKAAEYFIQSGKPLKFFGTDVDPKYVRPYLSREELEEWRRKVAAERAAKWRARRARKARKARKAPVAAEVVQTIVIGKTI